MSVGKEKKSGSASVNCSMLVRSSVSLCSTGCMGLPSRRSPISLNAQPSPASAHDTSFSASALILRRFGSFGSIRQNRNLLANLDPPLDFKRYLDLTISPARQRSRSREFFHIGRIFLRNGSTSSIACPWVLVETSTLGHRTDRSNTVAN